MPNFGNRPARTFPLLVLCALATTAAYGPRARAQTDSTFDMAQRLLRRAYSVTRDTPLGQNAEAGQIIAALRSSGDKDLLPFFQKMRQSKAVDNQIFGMVASAILAKQAGMDPEGKDFKYVDTTLLFSSKDPTFVGPAVASLIDAGALGTAQLQEILAKAPDAAYRAMAAGELNRLKKLDDRAALLGMLKDDKELVRYYAAVSLLSGSDAEQKAALACLKELTAGHDLRQAPIQALMLVRMEKETITAGLPWAAQIAADEQCDEGLRYTAVSTLLRFKAPEGAQILGDMIQKQKDSIQQVKLGLISIEHAGQIKPAVLGPLVNSKSVLAKTIGTLAQKSASGGDSSAELLALLKEGHPIVLDWALAYADRAEPGRRLDLRATIINQATIVDNIRDRDFERAAVAAQKILTDDGEAGRKRVTEFLRSENRAVMEATLAGIFRSEAKNQSDLIPAGVWEGLTKTTSLENATNYAALILAREGRQEALVWLPGMVMGGTAQGPGFRSLAGWYYAKLKGQSGKLLDAVLAD